MEDFEVEYTPLAMSREVRGLKGDKQMTEFAIESTKNEMADLLKGEMGNDMKAVLNGEKRVELPKNEVRKFKIINSIKNFLRKF